MAPLTALVRRAQSGDLEAFGRLVQATQPMAYGAARSVLRDASLAQDAVQQAYVRAWRRLDDLHEPQAFPGWLRRIVISVSLNMRRARRTTLLCLDDVPDVPVLDAEETSWSEAQRRRLSAALLTLTPDERQLCDRRYHGQWTTARLAAVAGVDDGTMRKRLQRVRDKLRKEIEMREQRAIAPEELRADLPEKVVELLARPRLIDLPENPVGKTTELVRATWPELTEHALPEVVDMTAAGESSAIDAVYVDPLEFHRIDARHILRYDLTLPLLLSLRDAGAPFRIWAAGKAYRMCHVDATHLEAFHQAEVLWMDEQARLDPWLLTSRVLRSVDAVLPGRTVKIVPTQFSMCSQAWELEVEDEGRWFEVMAWGIFTDRIVRLVGGDPATHTLGGVGYGLERLAMLRYGIDDIRKVEIASVA
jgi:RNA polymerase sigma-70 factor (ECF subfamily)